MNILREVRRVNNRSMPVRIIFLLTFCVIFVVTTYAWFSTSNEVNLGGLHSETTPWDVSYYIKADEDDDETQMLDETASFIIDEFYPGMPSREDIVNIYNLGSASTEITYELISVKVFGQEVLKKKADGSLVLEVHKTDENGEEVVEEVAVTTSENADGIKTTVFAGDTAYPFEISYNYDKTKLIGKYVEGDEETEKAHATLSFTMDWDFEGTEDKDILDTQFGKNAYKYYEDGNDKTKALEVLVKITSKMIHPSQETN